MKGTSEHFCLYFMKETSENACFYFMIGVCTRYNICDVVRNKLQTITAYFISSKEDQKFKKRICHVNVV